MKTDAQKAEAIKQQIRVEVRRLYDTLTEFVKLTGINDEFWEKATSPGLPDGREIQIFIRVGYSD